MVLFKLVAAETFLFASSIYIPLWSYSNVEYVIRNVQGQNLHSTMVLFKFESINTSLVINAIYIPLWSYSNPICKFFHLGFIKFTFHYGPIQICYRHIYTKLFKIYIPLWSYSNLDTTSFILSFVIFTFHYGPIQI